jgi:flagellar biosynthesis protein FlhA
VIIIHLTETIRRHAHELLGREDVKVLVDGVHETSPTLVDELIPKVMSMAALHRVLLMLLEERVSIANLPRILESLAGHAPTTNDYADLVEHVRKDIGRSICNPFRNDRGHMRAILFHPQIEMEFRRAIHDKVLAIDVGRLEKLIARLEAEQKKAQTLDRPAALLCDESIRRPLRKALVRSLGSLAVIAYQEIPKDLLIETVTMIKPEELGGEGDKVTR